MIVKLEELNLGRNFGPLAISELTRLPSQVKTLEHCEYTVKVIAVEPVIVLDFILIAKTDYACQRCLMAAKASINEQFEIAVIDAKHDVDEMMVDYDCVEIKEGVLELETIALDQLIMSLPAYHENSGDCQGNIVNFIHSSHNEDECLHPFNGLASLIQSS